MRTRSNYKWTEDAVNNLHEFIKSYRVDIKNRKKNLLATDEEVLQAIINKVDEDRTQLPVDTNICVYSQKVAKEIVWKYANKQEADGIIRKLKSGDESFIKDFFYGTNLVKCNISRFRSKIISQIRETYRVNVSIAEFGNILYTLLWDNGSWGVLDSYQYQSSIFSWLEQIARHEVIKTLEDYGEISVNRERTSGNTRLLGVSVDPLVWDFILSEVMPNGLSSEILRALLVDGKNQETVRSEMGLNEDQFNTLQKKAEIELKDKVIRSDSYFEQIIIRDKSARNIMVTEEYIADFAKWQEEKNCYNIFADVFGANCTHAELQDKIVKFLYSFSEQMNWSDEDRLLWRMRFIENVAPVKAAEYFGRKRSWIDNKYSRLNARFNKAIKDWWAMNCE